MDALQRVESAEIGELARLHDVHRSTTLRLLHTLEQFGYVTRGDARGEFRLGAGHLPFSECPAQFNAITLDFLARHPL